MGARGSTRDREGPDDKALAGYVGTKAMEPPPGGPRAGRLASVSERYDAVVIGLGPGGEVAARACSPRPSASRSSNAS
jgi:hypothetical protein